MDNGEEWDPEIIRRKKAVTSTTKALITLGDSIAQALARCATQSKDLEALAEEARTRKMKAEKTLEAHVTKIYELVKHHQQQQQQRLTESLKHFLEQVMVYKMEELNHEARLSDLDGQVREKLRVITEKDDATKADRKYVTALTKEFNSCTAPSLVPKIEESVTYTLKVPAAIADTIQTLVGQFVTLSDITTIPPFTSHSSDSSAGKSSDTSAGKSSKSRSPQHATSERTAEKSTEPKHSPLFRNLKEKVLNQTPASSAKTTKKSKQTKKEPQTNQDDVCSAGRPTTKPVSSPQLDTVQSPPSEVPDKFKQRVFIGRGKAVSGLAGRADGKVWLVYNSADPHLDLLDKTGTTIVLSKRIGGNTEHVASYGAADVVVASNSPRSVTVFRQKGNDFDSQVIKKMKYRYTGLAVNRLGMAVSSSSSIYWWSWSSGENNQWIVSEDDSSLQNVSSVAILEAQGKLVVCAADQGGEAVLFYRKSLRGRFVLFDTMRASDQKSFVPVSISAHTAGFLAILDSASRFVYIVAVEKERVTVRTLINGHSLCEGVPSLLSFRPETDLRTRPTLWVASADGHVYLNRLDLFSQL